MTHRYVPTTSAPRLRALPFTGLRSAFADGYGARDLRSDVLAGLVVGIVALPLSMALAIAVGVPPQHGLYTAIVAGFLGALTGGSRFPVTGPTAALVLILAPIPAPHGPGGPPAPRPPCRVPHPPHAPPRRCRRNGPSPGPRPYSISRPSATSSRPPSPSPCWARSSRCCRPWSPTA